jgi:hypothetical protein
MLCLLQLGRTSPGAENRDSPDLVDVVDIVLLEEEIEVGVWGMTGRAIVVVVERLARERYFVA